ncbi:MAG: GGDEF domain-containing protein [Coriobacteriia bacterium]|nr:GGDEF domain-containing protein [Coriobacteriia bacterium]
MRELLELCVETDRHAERLYSGLAEVCEDSDLGHTFAQLAHDESERTEWWSGLLDAWAQGLLPDVVNDTASLAERLEVLHAELAAIDLSHLAGLSPDEMLALAARLEFYMIDPVFGELIDLTEPARAERRHVAYQAHLQRLIDAIGRHYPAGSLAGLLAQTLSRTWRDNLRLAVFATHDTLTGLHNRRALYTHLPQWTAWSSRYGHPLTVLLIDVDEFKAVNDRHGHGVGDEALKAIAQALTRAVRASDLVVRYGGDEFAVIAPETDADEYALLCDRILETVRSLKVTGDDREPVPLTVSVGGTITRDPAGSAPRRIDKLLAAADRSLYAAKHAGRDCAAQPTPVGQVE